MRRSTENDLFLQAYKPYSDIIEDVACPAGSFDVTTTLGRTIKIEIPYTALALHADNVEGSALDNSKITVPCPPNSGSLHPDRMYDTGQRYFELTCQSGETSWDQAARVTAAYTAACEDVNTDPNFNSYNSMTQLQGRQAMTDSTPTDDADGTMEDVTRDGTMMRCARDVAHAIGEPGFDVSAGFTNAAQVWDTRCDSGNPMKIGEDETGTACALNSDNTACAVESGECTYTHRAVIEDEGLDGFEDDVVDLLWNPEGLDAATTFGSGNNAPPLQGTRTGFKPGARMWRQASTIAVKYPCEKSMCTGQANAAGGACKLNQDFSGCIAADGTCVYVPEWTVDALAHDGLGQVGTGTAGDATLCETDEAEDTTAANSASAGDSCSQKGGVSYAYTLDDAATECADALASTSPVKNVGTTLGCVF
eukprot:SAG22_NODE_3315_length_1784_cov_0.930564_2_plen_421_part_01